MHNEEIKTTDVEAILMFISDNYSNILEALDVMGISTTTFGQYMLRGKFSHVALKKLYRYAGYQLCTVAKTNPESKSEGQ